MTPVDQKYMRGDGTGIPGDCVRACTASILNLLRRQVPHFVRKHGSSWQWHWEDWLEARGIAVVMPEDSNRPDCLYLAGGVSPRGIHHMVVMKGRELVHDPHPSRAGVKEVDRVWLLVPIDIGQAMAHAR
jgi:hypothetical protein